ncbi:MAG: DUF1566 domain-containing protein [Treponema sp.]|nr:DUF1566 domain-containing protein [Treponema sp.]
MAADIGSPVRGAAVAASTNASAGTYIKSFKITAVGAGSTYIDVKITDTATSTESHKYIPVKVSSDKKLKSKTAAEIKIEVTDKNPAENKGGTTYEVIVETTGNGTVTAKPSSGVAEGTEVTLEIKPETGYALDTLTVDGADKKADVADGKYTFTMPASNVTVSAKFKATGPFGSKTSPDAVGDIVFSDGTAVPYTAVLTYAQKQAAVAVIFDATKKLGVGLKQGTGLAWEDDTTGYPASDFANTYGVSVAGDAGGWYLPAKDELKNLCEIYRADGSAVKEALAKFTDTINLSTGRFWSSSQGEDNLAYFVDFGTNNLFPCPKTDTNSVCAVRVFN